MRYLVTGAGGFVLGAFLRSLLTTEPDATVVALDLAEPEPIWYDWVAELRPRIQVSTGDVRDAATMRDLVDRTAPDVVVHAATVTHVPAWERADPGRYLDVNVTGTARVLAAAGHARSVRRVVHVSSAAVYGAGPDTGPQPEDTAPAPDETYGISKVAAELVAARAAELYGLDVPVVRFAKVFGPLERPTGARRAMSLPYHLAAARLRGTTCPVTARSRRAAGDWISAVDVADALCRLVRPGSPTGTYNVAGGRLVPVPELADAFGLTLEETDDPAALDMDPADRTGKNGACAIGRAADELGWTPRPLAVQVDEYLAWARRHPAVFTAV